MIASSWAWVMTFFATSASRTAFSLAFALSSFSASAGFVVGAVRIADSDGVGTAAKATPPRTPAPSTHVLTIATVFERRIEAAFMSIVLPRSARAMRASMWAIAGTRRELRRNTPSYDRFTGSPRRREDAQGPRPHGERLRQHADDDAVGVYRELAR